MKKLVCACLLITSLFANQKIVMVATSHDVLGDTKNDTGVWLSELVHAYNVFKKAGYDITIASPKSKPLPIDPGSIKNIDDESLKFLTNGKKRALLDNPKSLKELKNNNFDVVYLVGGHGVMWDFANDKNLKKLLVNMAKKEKIISSVCHGPAGLVNVKYNNGKSIIDGVKLTGFSNSEESAIKLTNVMPFSLEDALKKDGAIYSQAEKDFDNYVVAHKNFVTGQNPASAKAVAEKIVSILSAK